MTDPVLLHNHAAPELVRSIVKPVVENGGSPQDVLVLLESVAAGVVTYVARSTTGGQTEDQIVDMLAAGIKKRMPSIRLAGVKPAGNA